MKKSAVLLIIAFVTITVLSSCSNKNCPAYSKNNIELTDKNV
jgi:hypothetical protein